MMCLKGGLFWAYWTQLLELITTVPKPSQESSIICILWSDLLSLCVSLPLLEPCQHGSLGGMRSVTPDDDQLNLYFQDQACRRLGFFG